MSKRKNKDKRTKRLVEHEQHIIDLSKAYVAFDFDRIAAINNQLRSMLSDEQIRRANMQAITLERAAMKANAVHVSEEDADAMSELLDDVMATKVVLQ